MTLVRSRSRMEETGSQGVKKKKWSNRLEVTRTRKRLVRLGDSSTES